MKFEALLRWILWPLTLPYGAVVRLKAFLYRKGAPRQRRLDAFVISVGNLTAGGTGKTPMVMWMAQRFVAEGKPCGILTRGYRGEESSSGSTSDEVRMMRSRLGDSVAFGVGADRYAQGRQLVARGIRWLILDDGFQHLNLARNVDMVLLDATNPFGGGHLLPAGRLREPRSALARADIIVITRSDRSPALDAIIRRYSAAPIYHAQTRLDSIHSFTDGQIADPTAPDQLPSVFAFCGIGNPSAFVSDLRRWGVPVVGHRFFPDHHRFATGDAEQIVREARAAGAAGVICTEKDLQNLHAVRSGIPAYFCSISLEIDREDEFWRNILTLAQSRAKHSHPNFALDH